MSTRWTSYVVALCFLVAACSVCGSQDTPVQSNGPSRSGGGAGEGVRGRVTRVDGSPVADALITPRALDVPSPPIPDLAVVTGRDGRYEWRLTPGHYEITVSADGYRLSTKQVTVTRARVTTLDFTLELVQ